jgi:hypothetical protein
MVGVLLLKRTRRPPAAAWAAGAASDQWVLLRTAVQPDTYSFLA